jgi:colanic acid/amylovoran biosynthesis protein
LPRQNEEGLFEETAGRWGIVPDQYISVIVSALWRHYCSERSTYLDFWRRLVLRLVHHAGFEGRQVCLVPHTVAEPHGDERVLIREVVEGLPAEVRSRVVPIDGVLGPTRTRLLLGHGLLTITGRMHAAVSTFQMGRSALSLSYSVKYGGVIGDSFGRQDLVLPCAKGQIPDSDWSDGSLAERILAKVDYILANRVRLEREIKEAVARQKELADESLRRVVEIVESQRLRQPQPDRGIPSGDV